MGPNEEVYLQSHIFLKPQNALCRAETSQQSGQMVIPLIQERVYGPYVQPRYGAITEALTVWDSERKSEHR